MTLAELAKVSGYSTGTINGLELHGEGSERLKKTLRDVLTPLSQTKESVISGVEFKETRAEYKTSVDWQSRATSAEKKLAAIRSILDM